MGRAVAGTGALKLWCQLRVAAFPPARTPNSLVGHLSRPTANHLELTSMKCIRLESLRPPCTTGVSIRVQPMLHH